MHTVHSTRKARKAHYCDVCGPNIQPGDEYHYQITFDGDLIEWKTCTGCESAVKKAQAADYGDWMSGLISNDDVIEWAEDHAGHGGMIDDPDAHALLERIGP